MAVTEVTSSGMKNLIIEGDSLDVISAVQNSWSSQNILEGYPLYRVYIMGTQKIPYHGRLQRSEVELHGPMN